MSFTVSLCLLMMGDFGRDNPYDIKKASSVYNQILLFNLMTACKICPINTQNYHNVGLIFQNTRLFFEEPKTPSESRQHWTRDGQGWNAPSRVFRGGQLCWTQKAIVWLTMDHSGAVPLSPGQPIFRSFSNITAPQA